MDLVTSSGPGSRRRQGRGDRCLLACGSPGPIILVPLLSLMGWLLACEAPPPTASVAAALEVPQPDLSRFEAVIRERVEALQQEVVTRRTELEGNPRHGGEELAAAFGRLGNLYHAFLFLGAAETCYRNATLLDPQSFEWHYYLASVLSHQGKTEAAVESFASARSVRGDDVPTLVRLGDLELQLGDSAAASHHYREALAVDPSSVAAHFGLGRAAKEAGDLELAVRELETTLQLEPGASAVHYLLAQLYRRLGRTELAEAHMSRRGEVGITMPDPLMQRVHLLEVTTSIDVIFALAGEPERRTDEELVGFASAQLGKLEGAVGELARAVSRDHDPWPPAQRARVQLVLGCLQASHGRSEDAVANLRQALASDPELTYARLCLASALQHAEQWSEAAEELQRLLSREPDNSRARLLLGSVLERLDEPVAAAHQLERALSLPLEDADRMVALHRLGELERRGGSAEAAMAHYRQALAIDADFVDAHLGLAAALGSLGRYGDAVAEYRRVVELDRLSAEARLGEATALILAGRHADARDRLEEALTAMPGEPRLALTLARHLAACPDPQVRDGKRALELARSLVDERPTFEAVETLAMALAETGQFEAAAEMQRQLLAQARQTGVAAGILARLAANLERYRRGLPCCAGA